MDNENKPEISDLFAAYDQAQAAREAAEKAVADAQAQVSAAVEAIGTNYGPGPYERNSQLMTAVRRESKKTGAVTWFFKSRSSAGAIVVD